MNFAREPDGVCKAIDLVRAIGTPLNEVRILDPDGVRCIQFFNGTDRTITVGGGSVASTDQLLIVRVEPPRPDLRSIWDVCGLRRRPKTSRGRR
jgi:hypothetical protein